MDKPIAATLMVALFLPLVTLAGPEVWEGWQKSPEDAQLLARKSGKPLLVITTWKDGV
jgi:hypothetical protein